MPHELLIGDTFMTIVELPTSGLVDIRAAHHPEVAPKYDRIVFDFEGPVPQIEVQYVKQLIGDGSGLPIAISGRSILQVRFSPAQAHNDAGQPTAPNRVKLYLPVLKEVARVGDFEGVVSYGLGLSKKCEIRVITLLNKSRVVIDVLQ
jgi:hypothetical protein